MQASARNQFSGVIKDIQLGAVNAEVHVSIAGGDTVIATVTKDSIDNLAIKVGAEVIALIKAPQIIIVTDFGGYRLSARNQLAGTVTHVRPGAINSEIDIALTGGDIVAATVTNDSVASLGITVGQAVTAVFKAGAVILAIAASD
jgi:molybdate transport system regulatory protein